MPSSSKNKNDYNKCNNNFDNKHDEQHDMIINAKQNQCYIELSRILYSEKCICLYRLLTLLSIISFILCLLINFLKEKVYISKSIIIISSIIFLDKTVLIIIEAVLLFFIMLDIFARIYVNV